MSAWYLAEEAKRPTTMHKAGHRRLGDSFTRCGKRVGAEVAGSRREYYDTCLVCREEELRMAKRRQNLEVPGP